MKKHIYRLLGLLILIIAFAAFTPVVGQSNGEPPEPPGQHGQTGNQPVGGGTPIGEGITVLTLLGTAWAGRKWYLKHKQTLAE